MKKDQKRGKPILPWDPVEDPGALNKLGSAGGARLEDDGDDTETRTGRRRREQSAPQARGHR